MAQIYTKYLRKIAVAMGLGLIGTTAFSQTADFSLSKSNGCGNTDIEITDKSKGTTKWEWNFGNGVTKTVTTSKNFRFVYPASEKDTTYIITLKAWKGDAFDVATKTVTIHPNPQPDFEVESFSGCISTDAVFKNITVSTAPIKSYLWTFDDGSSSTEENPSHAFIKEASYTIILEVTDQNGCVSTIKKENLVEVTKPLTVDFSATVRETCTAPLTTAFTPTISNGTAVAYEWDFGDGEVSDEVNPSHTYASDGAYNVSLTAKTSSGCPTTMQKAGFIQVNTYLATINAPADACTDVPVALSATVNSETDSWNWDFGNGTASTAAKPSVTYSTAGTYIVKLTVTSKIGCVWTAEKKIVVHKPEQISFAADKVHGCDDDELAVTFATAGNWKSLKWNYGDSSQAGTANTHTYNKNGSYTVLVEATDMNGCKSTETKTDYIKIGSPVASFSKTSDDSDHFCVNSNVTLTNTSTVLTPTATVEWNYSKDVGATNTDAVSSFSTDESGLVMIILTVTDVDGCASSFEDTVKIGDILPKPTITLPTQACYKENVAITGSATGQENSVWHWEITGEGEEKIDVTNADTTYKFEKPGEFTLKLVTKHFDCPSEEADPQTITILPPKAEFVFNPQVLCDFPKEVSFDASASEGAETYSWKFGEEGEPDFTTASTDATATHTYTKAGLYTITLKTMNSNGCEDEKSFLLNTTGLKMGFMRDTNRVCLDKAVKFTDTTKVKGEGVIAQWIWDFGDGSKIDTVHTKTISHIFPNPGIYNNIKLKVVTADGCVDSLTIDSVKYTVFSLPQIDAIRATKTKGCAPLEIPALKGNIQADYEIATYSWNFGDGSTAIEEIPSHTFVAAKSYDVSLLVTDVNNCSATKRYNQYITATFPKPNFTIPSVICAYNDLTVTNTSTGAGDLKYSWDWGDETSKSTEKTPTHLYDKAVSDTTFKVILTVTDENGCSDAMTKTVLVAKPVAQFSSNETVFNCPPAKVSFQNESKGTELSFVWDLGEPTPTPVILRDAFWQYYSAGKYDVSLTVTDKWGCFDILKMPNYITVNGPKGTFKIEQHEGCTYSEIGFSAENAEDVATYSWIYGDGEFNTTTEPSSSYVYSQGNVYTPSLTMTDENGCEVSLFAGNVTIYGVEPDFTADLLACDVHGMDFTDISVAKPAPVESWEWVFTNGEESDTLKVQNVENHLLDYGVWDVKLITKVHGCEYAKDSVKSLKIYETPDVNFSTSANPVEILEEVQFANETDTSWISEQVFWKWQLGNVIKHDPEFKLYFSEAGDVDVTLVGYTHIECPDTASQTITVNGSIRIPNVFTPNGDGINDIFLENMPDVALIIINRWGQELYKGKGGWDGTCNGQEMSAGTYFYMVTLPNGKKYEGPLLLIRN